MLVKLDDYITSSKFFKWREALWLPSFKVHHEPSQQEVNNIIETCRRLDEFRNYAGHSFIVHCFIRPTSVNAPGTPWHGKDYNAQAKGALASRHITGKAVDFHINGIDQDEAMKMFIPKLQQFRMSAENNTSANGRNWVHLDIDPRNGIYCLFNP